MEWLSPIKPPFGTPLNRSHWAAQGLVAHYAMNEMGGDLVHDSCGMNDGRTSGMAPFSATSGWVPGPHGGALAFDGISGGITTPLLSGNNGSVIMRVNLQSTDSGAVLWGNSPGVQPSLQTYNGKFDFYGNGWDLYTAAGLTLITGTYIVIVCTWDQTEGAKIYINNRLIQSDSSISTTSSGGGFYIGNYANARFCNMIMDYLSAYNRALTAQEIAYLYAFPWCLYESQGAWEYTQANKMAQISNYYRQLRAA